MGDERAVGSTSPGIWRVPSRRRPHPVVVGLPVAVCDDADAGREQAAKLFEAYLNIPRTNVSSPGW